MKTEPCMFCSPLWLAQHLTQSRYSNICWAEYTKKDKRQTEPTDVSIQIINTKFYNRNLPTYIIVTIIKAIIIESLFTIHQALYWAF